MFNYFTHLGDFYLEFPKLFSKCHQFRILEDRVSNDTRTATKDDFNDINKLRIELYPDYLVSLKDMPQDKTAVKAIYVYQDKYRKYACQLSYFLLVLKSFNYINKEQIDNVISQIRKQKTYCNFTQELAVAKKNLKLIDLEIVPIKETSYKIVSFGIADSIYEGRQEEKGEYSLVISLAAKNMIPKHEVVKDSLDDSYCYLITEDNAPIFLDAFKIIASFSREDRCNVIDILNQISNHYQW